MKYVSVPNLPEHPVRLVAVSEGADEVIAALGRRGIEVVTVKALEALPAPVASHSDMQILQLGGANILAVNEATELCECLTNFGFRVERLHTNVGDAYPLDISLNFLLLQNCCFGMSSAMPLQLIEYCNHAGLQVVHSKQGYARCSVAVVGKNAAITSDVTLYKLLTAVGIDTLLCGVGDILLPDYDTGFIGGCCGLISSNQLAFTGNLNCYRYGGEVLEFLEKHKVSPIYLTDGKLLDIGGILPLMEED